jgi:Fe2+ transport system protein FeoA
MEMGLVPGTSVTVVRLAPLGDPIDVSVRGYHLSLRKSEARGVWLIPATVSGSVR